MDALKKYTIPFKSLSLGKHRFEFDIDDKFFEAFDNGEIKGGKLTANVELTKAANLLTIDFSISGTVTVICDRCLEDCQLPIDYKGELVVRFSETENEYDGEVMWLHPTESELNIAQYLYESIMLNLPYQRVHPNREDGQPGCDPDMLSRFKIVSEEEFNRMIAPKGQKMEDNPQWEKLRKIKDQLEK